jgi:hypothetical protein
MSNNKITYMKLIENIKLNDGTIIDKGTSVRMNYKEGPFYNVELNENNNIKKIFWITEDQGTITIVKNYIWTKKKLEEHIKDLKETWFDVISKTEENKKLIIVDSISEKIVLPQKKRGRPKKIK